MLTTVRDGQYQILHKLGTGGMGEVYQARDTKLNRMVALKFLRPEQTGNIELQKRFIREAQAASALNHPNIVTIHDIVSEGGADILIMECVAGTTLVEAIPQGGLPVETVLNYGIQIASALTAAHAAGIVHRDLKPGNVMVSASGVVKILDFGLAKRLIEGSGHEEGATAPLTMEGLIMGTVSYMSPEQAQGRRVDARSDIFTFGALLYEMMTGVRAFGESDTISTLTAVIRDEVGPARAHNPRIPEELEQIAQRCLRKDPEARWQKIGEVHQALAELKTRYDSGSLGRAAEPARQEAVEQATPERAAPGQPAPSKAGLKTTGAVLGVAALAAALGGGVWLAARKAPEAAKPAVPQAAEQPVKVAPADHTLRNSDIVEMVRGKVSPRLIAGQIRGSETAFDLSPQEVIRLVKEGVPESVIEVMRDPKKPAAAVADMGTKTGKPEERRTAPGAAATIKDSTPVLLNLESGIPDEAAGGTALNFTVAEDVKVDGVTVIAKGARATGAIHEAGKKGFMRRSKMTYQLTAVQAVDGKQLRLRATPAPVRDEGPAVRPMLPAGTKYPGYIDGDAAVSGRR